MSSRRLSLVLAALVLSAVACSDGEPSSTPTPTASATTASGSASPTSASPKPSESPSFAGKVVDVRFEDGQVKTAERTVTVPRGTTVQINVFSDVAEEVHVHPPYEQEVPVGAGQTVTLLIDATIPGIFEIELHESNKLLVELKVT